MPLLPDRFARLSASLGWRRAARLRRAAAGLLVVVALVLAITPDGDPRGVPVVVAAMDIAAGSTLDATQLAEREYPAELVPVGAVDVAEAQGRVLVGAARAGEPLTDARLTSAVVSGPGSAAVPVRLADPDVAALVRAGSLVDVVTPGERAGEAVVLASDARVVTVVPAPSGQAGSRGPLVLVALHRDTAARVAAAALSAQVAVTLR